MDYNEAVAMTPEKYRHFVTNIKGNGYITVDGRVAWAIDESTVIGDISIHTEFSTIADQVVCKAVVRTARGEANGHARAFMDRQTGADSTNPLENAETSAVGRALGFLGYGVFGSGIASADEMHVAMAEQNNSEQMSTAKSPPRSSEPAKNYGLGATEKQINFLRTLLHQAYPDMGGDEIEDSIDAIKDDRDSVSAKITELKDGKPKVEPETSDDVKRKRFWANAREAMARSGKNEEDLRLYISTMWGKDSTKDLSEAQEVEAIEWLAEDFDDIPWGDTEKILKFSSSDAIDSMPKTWTTVQLLADESELDWDVLEAYLKAGEKVDDLDHASGLAIRRTIDAFKNQRAEFVMDVVKWQKNQEKGKK